MIDRGRYYKLPVATGALRKTVPAPIPDSWMPEAARDYDLQINLPDMASESGEVPQGRLRPDNTIWLGAKQVGTYDPQSGQISPVDLSAWEQAGKAAMTVGTTAVGWFFKPFEVFEDYVAKPFAAGLTAPFWQKNWWESKTPEEKARMIAAGYNPETPFATTEGGPENFFKAFLPEGEFRKAYEEWEAPVLTKGALEFIPWLAVPSAGKLAQWMGKSFKGGAAVAKVLTPYIKLEEITSKIIEIPIKAGAKVVRTLYKPEKISTVGLLSTEEILRDIRARHPERLPKGTFVEELLNQADVLKREDQQAGENAANHLLGIMDYIGRYRDLFQAKATAIPDTKLTHEMVTAKYIIPKTKGMSMAPADVLSRPDDYTWKGPLGQLAYQWAKTYQDVVGGAMKDFRTKYIKGKVINELPFEEGESYIPRKAIAKRDPATGKVIQESELYAGAALPGATPSWGRPRTFDKQIDGIMAGYEYASPDKVMDAFIRSHYNAAAAERGTAILAELAKSPAELIDQGIKASRNQMVEEIKGLKMLQGIIGRAGRGERLNRWTLRAVGKVSPDAERALRMVTDSRFAKLNDTQKRVYDLENRLAAEIELRQQLSQPLTTTPGSAKTLAIGADPVKKYELGFEVVEADLPIASHTPAFEPNSKYPSVLQPRLRERQINRDQVGRIARDLDPDALLVDTHRLDSGAPIIGKDNVVESGNGRVMALRQAMDTHPERYQAYRQRLEELAPNFGIKAEQIKKMKNPMLVRRQTGDVDRLKFVTEANQSVAANMSDLELAFADSHNISDSSLLLLRTEGKESLTDALREVQNSDFIGTFMHNVPAGDKGAFLASDGSISKKGIDRIANAVLAKAFPGRYGLRLAELNIEALSPASKSIITGMAGAAGDLVKLASAIRLGQVDPGYYIALDMAEAAERYIRNKAMGLPLEAAMQASLFEGAATPIQQALMKALDERYKSSGKVMQLIRDYTQQALAQPPPMQGTMFGNPIPREELLGKILGQQIPKSPVLGAEDAVAKKVVEKAAPQAKGAPQAPKAMPEAIKPAAGAEVPPVPTSPPSEMVPPKGSLEYEAYLRTLTPEQSAKEAGKFAVPEAEDYALTMSRLSQNIQDRLSQARAEMKVIATEYKAARYKATHAALTEGRIANIPAFMNHIFPDVRDDTTGQVIMTGREVADRITKIYTPEKVAKALQVASEVSRAGVTLKAALDFSWSFLQGSLVLGHDIGMWARGKPSNIWLKSTKAMLKAFFKPETAGQLDATMPDLARRAASVGVALERESEFIETGHLDKLLRKIPAGSFIGEIFQQTYGRAAASFSAGGKTARLLMFEQMEKSWVKNGGSPVELGEFVNKLTGVVSSKELGVSASRRAIESAVLFAPRYTRAYLMLTRDLLRGTMTGAEARRSMAGMLTGGLAAYVTLCAALGQEPKLNPAPKDLGGDGGQFMTFNINGNYIGVPGFWYSAIRAMAAVGAAAEKAPERLLSLDRDNPIVNFWMGRTSPLTGLTRDIVTGRDFLGNRLDSGDKWFADVSAYLLTVSGQNLIQGDPQGRFDRFGAEIFGLRAFQQSDWDKLRDIRDGYAVADFQKPYQQLNLEQRDQLVKKHPDYAQMADKAKDSMVLERGEDKDIWLAAAKEQGQAMYNAQMQEVAMGLLTGQIDYKTYLDAANNYRKMYSGQKWMLRYITDQASPESATEFQQYLAENSTPEDNALSRYLDIVGKPAMLGGVPDWDATEAKSREFMNGLDAATRDYVMRNKSRWIASLPPLPRKLAQIQAEGRDKLADYYSQDTSQKRIKYRLAYPEVDAWLVLMGRVSKPASRLGMQRFMTLVQERQLPAVMFPKVNATT